MTIAFHDVLGLFRGFGNMVELYVPKKENPTTISHRLNSGTMTDFDLDHSMF
jgi:hypothetical protein